MAGSISSLEMAISSVFSRWDGLQMAIDHKWGGGDSHQKPLNLASDVFSWFSQSKRCYIKITFRSFSIFFHGSNSVMLPSIAAPLDVHETRCGDKDRGPLLSWSMKVIERRQAIRPSFSLTPPFGRRNFSLEFLTSYASCCVLLHFLIPAKIIRCLIPLLSPFFLNNVILLSYDYDEGMITGQSKS
ncbi:hypothetical protein SDJN03_10622, partial [Cucurbita argyrosperma subsp. sororia]